MNAVNLLAELWWTWMSAMFWQVSVLIGIVWGIDLIIRNRVWPQVRHALWMLVLIKLVIPPMWHASSGIVPVVHDTVRTQIEQRWPAAMPDANEYTANENASIETTANDTGSLPVSVAGQQTSDSGSTTPFESNEGVDHAGGGGTPTWQICAFALWILGMIVFVAVLLVRIARLRRWHQEQLEKQTIPDWYHQLLVKTAKRLELEQLPAIVFSDQIVTPAVYGIWNPVMILPRRYTEELSEEEAEHVLLHELAHLKRGDLWWHGFWLLVQIVYWFNPLLFLARKQIQHVREICCDLTVANLLREKTSRYRQTLLNTARELLTESVEPGLGLLGVFEDPFRLVARLRWLEKKTWVDRKRMLVSVVVVLAVSIPVLLPMASGGAQSRTFDQREGIADPLAMDQLNIDHRSRDTGAEALGAGPEDVYIRTEITEQVKFLGIPVRKRTFGLTESWYGDNRISITEDARQIIIDADENRLIVIDHDDQKYIDTTLPLEDSGDVAKYIRRTRRPVRSTGEVEDTGDTRKLLDRECVEYLVTTWDLEQLADQNLVTFKVWATTDLEFDWSLLDEYLAVARMFYNRDARFRSELNEIEGIQMRVEFHQSTFPIQRMVTDRVIEISSRIPPRHVYEPPADYDEMRFDGGRRR